MPLPHLPAARGAASSTSAASAAVAAVLLLSACGGQEKPAVETATVGRATVREVVEAAATVEARAAATVSSPASGKVAELEVEDGEKVKAGQVLLRIDSPQARTQLSQARRAAGQTSGGVAPVPRVDVSAQQGQVDEAAEQGFRTAREAAEALPDEEARTRQLAAVEAAEEQYLAAREQARSAVGSFNASASSLNSAASSLSRAQRAQTGAAVAIAEQTVDALTVRAPISGVVSLRGGGGGSPGLPGGIASLPPGVQGQAADLLQGSGGSAGAGGGASTLEVGSPVSAGAPLLAVTDTSKLALAADIDETDVLLVKPGVPAEVELDAVPGATYAATVTSVDIAPTTSGRGGVSYTARLSLGGGTSPDGSPAPTPRPGMSAVADLLVREARDVVAAPASAVFKDGQRDAVWVLDAGGALRKRPVRLGAQGEDSLQVVEGLQPGERVVVRGADTVSEGQRLP